MVELARRTMELIAHYIHKTHKGQHLTTIHQREKMILLSPGPLFTTRHRQQKGSVAP